MKCARCPRDRRRGFKDCERCAAKTKERYWREKARRETQLRGNLKAQLRQAAKEDAIALQWLQERGLR